MSLTRTAQELAAAFAAGEATAAGITSAHLARAESTQDALNAFTLIDGDRAMERARYLDERRGRGHNLGPLAGVPVAVKDLIDQAGVPTTAGSSFYREVPERSAPVVARLEAAGAVINGRTGLHEFAFGFSSENHWWGPVRNPWNADLSPGGSSGGSAAAVADGAAPVALGTDTGGSVRVPAALCGLVGLKVTHGRVPLTGVFPLAASLDTVGVIARTAVDAGIVYELVAGDDPADPWSSPLPLRTPGEAAPLQGLRIAVPRPWVDQPTASHLKAAFTWALDHVALRGAVVSELRSPTIEPPGLVAESFSAEVASVHRAWFEARPEDYGPEVAERIALVLAAPPDDYVRGLAWRSALRHAFFRLFDHADVIATPAVGANHKIIGRDTIDVDGVALPHRPLLSGYSALVNHAGLPAIVVPLTSAGEPPPSLQLIGRPWREAQLLEIAAALEATGIAGFRPPPTSDFP